VDTPNLTLTFAFLAGLVSFASPCVLPLVPAYLGYLGGTSVMASKGEDSRQGTAQTFFHALFFVLGFGLVFILLGATATLIGQILFDSTILLQRVGGVLLVIFGLKLMGVGWGRKSWALAAMVVALITFVLDSGWIVQGEWAWGGDGLRWLQESLLMGLVVLAGAGWSTARQVILAAAAGILNFMASYDAFVPNLLASGLIVAVTVLMNRTDLFFAEKKIELEQTGSLTGQTGYLRSLLFGVVFAAGWTPCVGPILASILVVASQMNTVGQGVLLLTAYTLGLGIPFLLVGLAFGPVSKWLRKMNRYVGVISILSGVVLALMGILIFTDSLSFLAGYGSFVDLEL
jgi:cytochrome c-type biogenesis protein